VTHIVAITNPATRHTQFLTRRGIGEALWIPGPPSRAIRFSSQHEAEEAAECVREARVGYCYVVAVIPEEDNQYRLVIYTPTTGIIESLDGGELSGLVKAEFFTDEGHTEEVAASLRMLAVGQLYEVSVHSLERPRLWWWWLLDRLGLG
jgi:hypothetical protein